jgi:hypothetical protein
MVSELRGLEFEPGPRINYVARNSHLHKSIRWGLRSIDQWTPHVRTERRGSGWHAIGGMLKPDKKAPSPLLYHVGFMVGMAEEVPSSRSLKCYSPT